MKYIPAIILLSLIGFILYAAFTVKPKKEAAIVCPYEGIECPDTLCKEHYPRPYIIQSNSLAIDTCSIYPALRQESDYQIVLVPAKDYRTDPDSIQIWDGKRLVGTVAIIENTPIGNLIYDDNQ